MNNNQVSITNIQLLEAEVLKTSEEKLADLLFFFRYIQETLLIVFANNNQLIQIPDEPDNPKLFVFLTTARAFSISKIAMDITIRGYPLEGFSLNRTLAELYQCTQYLLRHPGLIDAFIKREMKLRNVLKRAKAESDDTNDHAFSKFWGLMSQYTHASPDMIVLPTEIEKDRIKVKLVLGDIERIEQAAYGCMTALFIHYFLFRLIFLNDFQKNEVLSNRDKLIFNPDNMRKYVEIKSLSDDDLESLQSLFTPNSAKD